MQLLLDSIIPIGPGGDPRRIDEPAFDPAIGIRPSHFDGIAMVRQARGLEIDKTRKRIASQDFVVYPTYGTSLVMSAYQANVDFRRLPTGFHFKISSYVCRVKN